MSKVTLKLLLMLHDKIGKKELQYDVGTVKELINKFIDEYRENFEEMQVLNEDTGHFKDWMLILLNGRNIRFLEGLDTKLKDNDVIVISPPMAGG